jgi:hypothetical protein
MGWTVGVLFLPEASDFSLIHRVQADNGDHSAYYSLDTGALFSRVKWKWSEADHSSPSIADVKKGGAIPPQPLRLHSLVLNELSTWAALPFKCISSQKYYTT